MPGPAMPWLVVDARPHELAGHGRIVGTLPPRLMLLEPHPGTRAQSVPGTVAVDRAPVLTPPATPAEQLFIDAWLLTRQPKERPEASEGLPWDSPGHQPPR